MLNPLIICVFIVAIGSEAFGKTTTRYEEVLPGQGIVVEQRDTVNCLTSNFPLVIYGSINNESEYYSSASESSVYEGEGTKGKFLGTLFSLDSSGPIITNSTNVTIFSNKLSNGGFLVRLHSDIKDMDYSFLWFADHQRSREISLKGIFNLAAVTILDTTYSETTDFLYMDSLNLSLNQTLLFWNAITLLDVDKVMTDFFSNAGAPFNCRQSVPGKVNTFVVQDGNAHMHFIWWNTTYEKQVFLEGDHFFMHTSDYGNVTDKSNQIISNPAIPTFYPSGIHFRGTGDWNISYVSGYAHSPDSVFKVIEKLMQLYFRWDGYGAGTVFGSDFQVQWYPISIGASYNRIPGEMEMTIVSQLPCNFMGPGSNYTCIYEFYILDTIDNAIIACNALNGTLPIFHDYEDVSIMQSTTELTFLKPSTKESNFKVWLGYKDGKWLDGSNFKPESNYSVTSDPPSSLVYDRQTKEIMEWKGPAAMICQFEVDSKGLCANEKHVDYQFFPTVPMCMLEADYSTFDISKSGQCHQKLARMPNYPEPQSYKENEIIYSFAKVVKISPYLGVDHGTDSYPESQSHLFLNYQGATGQDCTIWMDSGRKMNYTNFMYPFDNSMCSNPEMCLMRLLNPNAGKWELRNCTMRAVGLCVKYKE